MWILLPFPSPAGVRCDRARKKQRVAVLGPKSKMTKHQAQDSLDVTVAQKTGGTARLQRSPKTKGNVKDLQGTLGAQQGRYHRQCQHAADRGGREADAGCDLRRVDGETEAGRSRIILVRWVFSDGAQVVDFK